MKLPRNPNTGPARRTFLRTKPAGREVHGQNTRDAVSEHKGPRRLGPGSLRHREPAIVVRRQTRAVKNRLVAFPPRHGDGFVTVDELIDNLPRLGIPDFQRGRVWNNSAVSSLMESLIDDTPCGSIILWRPRGGATAHGERPSDWGDSQLPPPTLLVVDGQQRLTALQALWHDDWAVNLAAFPTLGSLPKHRVAFTDAFVPWPPPLPENAGPTTAKNYHLRTQHLIRLTGLQGDGPAPSTGFTIDESAWNDLVQRIRNAGRRRFHVLIKRGSSLPEIVNLYNRINSSGVPVRKEERAYAAMVAIDPLASTWLRQCFMAAHPPQDDGAEPSRDAVLKRQRERFFGFPLFVAAYAQTVGFHRDLKGDLDLLARDNPDLSWVETSHLRQRMRQDSLECVRRTATALRETLLCDDLRFLPSAEPLRLAFALLLKFPEADESSLARALLLGQLNRIVGHTKPARIERKVLDANRLSESASAFPSATEILGDSRAFELRLRRVDSMNDPWVSLMYWYQRSLNSEDYVPAAQGKRRIPLDVNARATKEHLVPFSWLYRHYELDPRGHSARHVVNAIGNLTMISGELNYAHGSEPVPLADLDPALLRAHHLDTAKVLDYYMQTIAAIRRGSPPDRIQKIYERFQRARTSEMAQGIYAWLQGQTAATPTNPGMAPRVRVMHPSPADSLRSQKGLPAAVKQQLLDMRVKRDGAHWLIYRTPGLTTAADKIRVTRDVRVLRVGLNVAGVERLVRALEPLLARTSATSSEVKFQIPLRSPKAPKSLELVAAFVRD